jgi:DNA repair protein RecN (Recombination protein N)
MSLKRITLKDFVIVKHLELDLSHGFSVLSGETGAGKSILIDAIQLALGARADTSVIREGATKTEITLEFDQASAVGNWLSEHGFDLEPDQQELVIRRIVDSSGKSRAWINASVATAAQLKELADQLIDIHGQHAWQSLTRANSVRELLDAYAGINTQPISQIWSELRASRNALSKARADQDKLLSERDRLMWQITEVDKLSPQSNEWEDLNAQHTRLANAQTLIDVAHQAFEALQGDEQGADHFVAVAQSALEANSHLDPEFADLAQSLSSVSAQISDVAHSLQSWLKRTDVDPEGLAQLDERLSMWLSFSRRYKRQPEELPALYESWKLDLQQLDQAVDIQGLELQQEKAQKAYNTSAAQITKQRTLSASKLSAAITQAMQGLGMQGGSFLVHIEPTAQAGPFGEDEISFLVAAHPGSTPRPVGKVASGGELSRISLAIAVTTSQLGQAQTLIFDEVDSGIGGAVAQTVGRLMKKLGVDRQVLAVTHLPQVASCADHHWVVSKSGSNEGTLSQIQAVMGEQRVQEIARMLGGEQISATTQAHAREMIEQALLKDECAAAQSSTNSKAVKAPKHKQETKS